MYVEIGMISQHNKITIYLKEVSFKRSIYFVNLFLGIKPDNPTWTSAFGTLSFNKQVRKTDFRSDQWDN